MLNSHSAACPLGARAAQGVRSIAPRSASIATQHQHAWVRFAPVGAARSGAARLLRCAASAPAVEQQQQPSARAASAVQGAVTGVDARGQGGAGLHAVVVGSSLAGMTAAQELLNTGAFARVTVVERDDIRDSNPTERRGGVPQFSQPHVLLLKGLEILEGLWPGVRGEMLAAGARPLCFTTDVTSSYEGRLSPKYDSPLVGVAASRGLVERAVRARLYADPRVSRVSPALVAGLEYDEGGDGEGGRRSVTGVRLKAGGDSDSGNNNGGGNGSGAPPSPAVIGCDLVVDASGRGSRVPDWLEAGGYPRPTEQRINAGVKYATAVVRPRPASAAEAAAEAAAEGRSGGGTGGGELLNCFQPPFRHAVVLPVEGGVYQVILAGVGADAPPTEVEGYLAWAASLPSPFVADFLEGCEFVQAPRPYSRTENARRFFGDDLPDGLVVLGDAAACFNPVYGQGITVGALGAQELGRCITERLQRANISFAPPSLAPASGSGIAEGELEASSGGAGGDAAAAVAAARAALRGMPADFQRRLSKLTEMPWAMATSRDLQVLGGEAAAESRKKAGPAAALVDGYMRTLMTLSAQDPQIHFSLAKTIHMLESPASLFSPAIALRMLRLKLAQR